MEQSMDSVNKLSGTMWPAEDRAGYAGQFGRAPGYHVHANPGHLRQSAGNCWRAWASSISNSPTRRTPSKASMRSWPAARLRQRRPRRPLRERPARLERLPHRRDRLRRPERLWLPRQPAARLRAFGRPALFQRPARSERQEIRSGRAGVSATISSITAPPIWPPTRSFIWARFSSRSSNTTRPSTPTAR